MRGSLGETARDYTALALETLVKIIQDPNAPHAAKARCAEQLPDRGWGKPPQNLEHGGLL
jgi:hypothetical protein